MMLIIKLFSLALACLLSSSLSFGMYPESSYSRKYHGYTQTYTNDYYPALPCYGPDVIGIPADNQGPFFAKAVATLACVAGVGYGIYKLCTWAFTSSDQQITDQAQNAIQDAQRYLDSNLNPFYVELANLNPELINHGIPMLALEPLLYEHAIFHYSSKGPVDTSRINSIQNNLHSVRRIVQERIEKLKKNRKHMPSLSVLESCAGEINRLMPRYELLQKYLAPHHSYFNLFELEAELMAAYKSELVVVRSYAHDPVSLNFALRSIILTCADSHVITYPYIHYARRIKSNCDRLDSLIKSTPSIYTNRLFAAQDLLHILKNIYQHVIIQDVYIQEKQAHYLAELQKERIATEKEKAAAAASHAAAAHAQAQALQQQAVHMAEQNKINHERNRLLYEQNYMSSFPQTQVHVVYPGY
jgi:hypothetical protein